MKHEFDTFPLLECHGWLTPDCYSSEYGVPPRSSGLYAFVFVDVLAAPITFEILYVGMSKNLRLRTTRHNLLARLRDRYRFISTYFKPCRFGLRGEERKLINHHNPPYNLQHRQRG